MIEAKCYGVWGRSRYYRTKDGETFSIADNKHYFYHGNVITGKNAGLKLLNGEEIEELKSKIEFAE